MAGLTHFDAEGRARMVDISDKDETARVARAEGWVRMAPETFEILREGRRWTLACEHGEIVEPLADAGPAPGRRTGTYVRFWPAATYFDSPRIAPAAAFYLFYVAGLLILVSHGAYQDGDVFRALWQGALLGAVAYGTYEWTNYATLKDWAPAMVFTDWTWGTVLTGISAAGGVWATRAIFG